MGLPSLVVTLAGLIGFRGAPGSCSKTARSAIPGLVRPLGQQTLVGPLTFALILFVVVLLVVAGVVCTRPPSGGTIYVIGNNADVARYSGMNVAWLEAGCSSSGLVAGSGRRPLAARLGPVRGDLGPGSSWTSSRSVLLGGVSIFGGRGRWSASRWRS